MWCHWGQRWPPSLEHNWAFNKFKLIHSSRWRPVAGWKTTQRLFPLTSWSKLPSASQFPHNVTGCPSPPEASLSLSSFKLLRKRTFTRNAILSSSWMDRSWGLLIPKASVITPTSVQPHHLVNTALIRPECQWCLSALSSVCFFLANIMTHLHLYLESTKQPAHNCYSINT